MVKLYGKHAELIVVSPSELCNWSLELLLISGLDQSGDTVRTVHENVLDIEAPFILQFL
jgi:hypothetical protein